MINEVNIAYGLI